MIPETNIVDVEFSGSLHVEDEQVLHSLLQEAIDAHGKIRLLGSITSVDFGRVEPAAAVMDAKAAKFIPHIERAAMIMDTGLLEKVTSLAGKLLPNLHLRTFGPDERAAAETWVRG